MLQTRSYEMCRSSGNLIQWRKSLFDTILVYNNKNKPMLRYKFGSVYNNQRTIGPENAHLKPDLGVLSHNEMTLTLNTHTPLLTS